MTVEELKIKVTDGGEISREEALFLAEADLEELCREADEIRRHYFGQDFDLCAVISARSGRCSENCRYCAQSTCAQLPVERHGLIGTEE